MLKFFFLKNRLLYTHGNIAKIVHTISFLAFFPKNEITFEKFGQELCMLRKKIRPQKYIAIVPNYYLLSAQLLCHILE